MNDMRAVIVPKSDQMNADDLIGGAITITIREITIRPGTEQPVSMYYEGDGGKPFKPCKSMARVLVQCWGPDANKYIGRSMTLYRDPKVKWGGMAVGGIRVSHLSDIPEALTMALTETKGSKKPFTVRPLKDATAAEVPLWKRRVEGLAAALAAEKNGPAWLEILRHGLGRAENDAEVAEIDDIASVKTTIAKAPKPVGAEIRAAFADAYRRIAEVPVAGAQDTGDWTDPDATPDDDRAVA